MKLKEVFGNMGFGFGLINNPACRSCKFFTDMKCAIADKVKEQHGDKNLNWWIKNYEEHNKCSFYKNKTKQ